MKYKKNIYLSGMLISTLGASQLFAQDYKSLENGKINSSDQSISIAQNVDVTSTSSKDKGSTYFNNNNNLLKKYTRSSTKGYNELIELTKEVPLHGKKIILIYKDLDSRGKIILSSSEYSEVKSQLIILEKSINSEDEKAYFEKIKSTFVNVSNLISK